MAILFIGFKYINVVDFWVWRVFLIEGVNIMSLGPHASLGAPGSLNRNMSIHEGVGAQGEYKEGV